MTVTEATPHVDSESPALAVIERAREQVADQMTALEHIAANIADWPEGVSLHPHGATILIPVFTTDELAAVARVLAVAAPIGSVRKVVTDTYAEVHRMFGGCDVKAYCDRETACTARVVGTETVEVPDPDAPKITVERDVVEWDCHPILANERLASEGEWT